MLIFDNFHLLMLLQKKFSYLKKLFKVYLRFGKILSFTSQDSNPQPLGYGPKGKSQV